MEKVGNKMMKRRGDSSAFMFHL